MYKEKLEEHEEQLMRVLLTLKVVQLFGNFKEYDYCTQVVVFLGYVVSKVVLEMDHGSIEAFQEIANPYQSFVKDFSSVMFFMWKPSQEPICEPLKVKLVQALNVLL